MQTDKLTKICIVVMTALLAIIASRPYLTPVEAHAQKQYRYELIRVSGQDIQDVVAKRTADGWEPVTLSLINVPGAGTEAAGFLLMRR
jgi:hypothetical protein